MATIDEKIQEQVSAWLDDELSDEASALISRRICSDDAFYAQAVRTLQIGQAMRNEGSIAQSDWLEGIQSAIADESSLDAADLPATSAGSAISRWLRPVAGGAIAAAVALIALNWQPQPDNVPAPAPAAAAVVTETDAGGSADNASMPVEYVVPATVTDSGLISADPELAAYFLSHSRSTRNMIPANGRVRIIATPTAGAERAMSKPRPSDDDTESDTNEAGSDE